MKHIDNLELVAVCTEDDFPGSLKPVIAIPLKPHMTAENFHEAVIDIVENRCFGEAWWWPDEYYEALISMINARFAGDLVAKSTMISENLADKKTYACIRVIMPTIECNDGF